jgi:hypothetical protein
VANIVSMDDVLKSLHDLLRMPLVKRIDMPLIARLRPSPSLRAADGRVAYLLAIDHAPQAEDENAGGLRIGVDCRVACEAIAQPSQSEEMGLALDMDLVAGKRCIELNCLEKTLLASTCENRNSIG